MRPGTNCCAALVSVTLSTVLCALAALVSTPPLAGSLSVLAQAQSPPPGSGQGASAIASSAYPAKIVRVVIPWPGGSNDAAGRLVFQKIAESWGQPVLIENRSGASGTIGATLVARSAPDGYTLMVTSQSIVINAHLYKKLPYDVMKDFIGITPLAAQIGVLAVHPSLPVKSVKELIAFAKQRPGQLLYGSSGSGSFLHLAMAQFNISSATQMVHVPYKGGDAAGISLVAGETQAIMATSAIITPLLAANRVRVLAVTSDKRLSQWPDTPTVGESGVPGFEYTAWVGAFSPAGTPRPIIDRLHSDIKKALDHPEVSGRYNNIALSPMFSTPEQFAARMKADYDKAAKLIAVTGVTVN